jgi:hypothetical protein
MTFLQIERNLLGRTARLVAALILSMVTVLPTTANAAEPETPLTSAEAFVSLSCTLYGSHPPGTNYGYSFYGTNFGPFSTYYLEWTTQYPDGESIPTDPPRHAVHSSQLGSWDSSTWYGSYGGSSGYLIVSLRVFLVPSGGTPYRVANSECEIN